LNSEFIENKLNLIKFELNKSLPGKTSQNKMAPSSRRTGTKRGFLQRGGILILLYPVNNELYTVFIKRTKDNSPHSGQISFPGGRFEASDKSLQETALRETQEEIGVMASEVEIIGRLSPLHIDVSNIEVEPFVGVYGKKPAFKPDPREVEFIIEVKISDLLDVNIIQNKIIETDDYRIKAPVYNICNNYIWGATAMILSEFLEIVQGIAP
jgi:8-oxo-dGTP pyrophosphatase MutT (NUDIX family)